jgi:hypothetical protein
LTVADPVHLKAGLPEARLQAAAEESIVFGKEDSHRR